MNYCEKCRILFEDSTCPHCGNRFVSAPAAHDYVFLAEKEYPWSEVLEQALKDEGIPVVTNDSVVGAWITTRLGARFERSQLFVPFVFLDQASQILSDMFDNPELVDFEWEEENE